jgi:uncharacterized protein (DUF58 family)
MPPSILSRYLNPEVLNRLAGRRIDPRGLVLGNLAGSHKSPLSGFAVEFAGHREYAWGDDPKHIDWRLYFTRDLLFVKQYEMETNFVCHFMLDASASMRYGDGAPGTPGSRQKLAYAAQMIAALGETIVQQGDKISLSAFDEKVLGTVAPNSSKAQILRMAELLDGLAPVSKTQMAACLSELCGRTKRREIVMIFSDFFTDLAALEPVLQQMRYRRHEVVLFQVMHHDELAFQFDRMTKFVGLEIPDELMANPEGIRRSYLQAVEAFNGRLQEICERNRIERVLVDTGRDMAEVLIDYLNQRSRLHRRR